SPLKNEGEKNPDACPDLPFHPQQVERGAPCPFGLCDIGRENPAGAVGIAGCVPSKAGVQGAEIPRKRKMICESGWPRLPDAGRLVCFKDLGLVFFPE